MKAVVLAGGERAERFKTYLMGKKVIDYPLNSLKELYEVYLLTSGWSVDGVPILLQRRPGVTGAILDSVEALGLPILISYGDIVAEPSFYTSLKESCAVSAVASVPSSRHGKIGDPQSSYVFAGLISLDEGCFEPIKKSKNLMETINMMVREGLLKVVYFDGSWHDVDKPEDVVDIFPDVFRFTTDGYSSIGEELVGVNIKGKVVVEKGAAVEPGATLIGPVYVGTGALVGANSVVMGSAVEPGAIVEPLSLVVRSSVQPRARARSFERYERQILR